MPRILLKQIHGKKKSPIELYQGNFLDPKLEHIILEATVIYTNNQDGEFILYLKKVTSLFIFSLHVTFPNFRELAKFVKGQRGQCHIKLVISKVSLRKFQKAMEPGDNGANQEKVPSSSKWPRWDSAAAA
ncbi:hypothetical protein CRE_02383 [Caenorhabditis remanei]|uniref:Uncharacterized protein n=1 Tax=Caenorhabditis remanei TaxID=31234 RepID=E3MIJ1_CAERE|nr:hypothetical protein CRE_02383 [Caenorhabditis remanei]